MLTSTVYHKSIKTSSYNHPIKGLHLVLNKTCIEHVTNADGEVQTWWPDANFGIVCKLAFVGSLDTVKQQFVALIKFRILQQPSYHRQTASCALVH